MEAASWAVWGKTVRGPHPGGGGSDECFAEVTTDEFTATRTRTNGRSRLTWKAHGEKATTWATMTDAATALERLAGERGLWLRGAVFSRSDAVTFSSATDKERKMLLEKVLGLDRFDGALKLSKSKRESALDLANNYKGAIDKANAVIAGDERLVRHIESTATTSTYGDDPAALAALGAKLQSLVRSAQDDVAECDRLVAKNTKELGSIEARESNYRMQWDRLNENSCPQCLQDIDPGHRGEIQKNITLDMENIANERHTLSKSLRNAQAELKELRAELRDITSKHQSSNMRLVAAQTHAKNLARTQQALSDAKTRIATESAKLANMQAKYEKSVFEGLVHSTCADIFGIRGVRAHVVARALKGLETSTNVWLGELSDKISVTLRPQTTRASGAVVDAISMDVVGVGGGNGYAGASGGERRRIDVALMLGLGSVAEAAYGKSGTLVFDEVFDALDKDGVQRVVRVLNTISAERAVVVITHNDELVSLLRPAKHIHLESGEIHEQSRRQSVGSTT